jgi:Domain of unknown function (DUF397)
MDVVDPTPRWCKSSYSGSNGGACVEVAALADGTRAVRDSKDPEGPMITFTAAAWHRFTGALKS